MNELRGVSQNFKYRADLNQIGYLRTSCERSPQNARWHILRGTSFTVTRVYSAAPGRTPVLYLRELRKDRRESRSIRVAWHNLELKHKGRGLACEEPAVTAREKLRADVWPIFGDMPPGQINCRSSTSQTGKYTTGYGWTPHGVRP